MSNVRASSFITIYNCPFFVVMMDNCSNWGAGQGPLCNIHRYHRICGLHDMFSENHQWLLLINRSMILLGIIVYDLIINIFSVAAYIYFKLILKISIERQRLKCISVVKSSQIVYHSMFHVDSSNFDIMAKAETFFCHKCQHYVIWMASEYAYKSSARLNHLYTDAVKNRYCGRSQWNRTGNCIIAIRSASTGESAD